MLNIVTSHFHNYYCCLKTTIIIELNLLKYWVTFHFNIAN